MTDLRPCPFCGGGGYLIEGDVITLDGAPLYRVKCRKCDTSTTLFNDADAAAEFWNTRPKLKVHDDADPLTKLEEAFDQQTEELLLACELLDQHGLMEKYWEVRELLLGPVAAEAYAGTPERDLAKAISEIKHLLSEELL